MEEAPDPVVVDGQEEHYIERILDCRLRNNKLEYLIKWLGYSEEESTWEPRSHVEETEALEDWLLVHGDAQPRKRQRRQIN